jgi:hypothetical protein
VESKCTEEAGERRSGNLGIDVAYRRSHGLRLDVTIDNQTYQIR